jgi:hypothetical protein
VVRNFLCFLVLATLALAAPAFAQQSILLSGTTVPGHTMLFNNGGGYNPVAQDAGAAGGGAAGVGLSELNITARCTAGTLCASDGTGPNAEHFCIQDAPTTSTVGYHDLCFDANANGGNGLISFTALNGATAEPLTILVNGVPFSFPGNGGCASCGTLALQNANAVAISGGTINGAAVNPTGGVGALLKYITTGSTVTAPVGLDVMMVVNKTSGATTVTLPSASNFSTCPSATLSTCPIYWVKDGGGNAGTYNITVSTADGKTIDGASTNTLNTNYQATGYVFNGTAWNVF